jgi:uncharacterized protein (TIGR03083 family)
MSGTTGTTGLTRDQTWQAIDVQRHTVADLLERLADDEWDRPSLCAGWTVRDVAAHLTLQQVGLGGMLTTMPTIARARGNLDRAIHDLACRRAAALAAPQLIAGIRGMIGSRRHNLGVTYRETLIDILVHGQDIAMALDRPLDLPALAAAEAATRAWTMRWPRPFPIIGQLRAFHLTATDTDWSAGAGPRVRGPIGALLLVSCDRLAALAQLTGEGAADLTARLSSRRATAPQDGR